MTNNIYDKRTMLIYVVCYFNTMLNSFRNPDYIIIDFLKNVDSDNSDQAERMPTLSIRRAKKYFVGIS